MSEVYSQAHIRNILLALGVKVVGETYNDFLCLCPFHGNTDTPSFSVSQRTGLYLCFNPSCDATGTLTDLVQELASLNEYESVRFMLNHKTDKEVDFEDELERLLDPKPEFEPFPQDKLDEMYDALGGLDGEHAMKYLYARGISKETAEYFRLGYSSKKDMIVIPVHSPDGIPIGVLGRSPGDKTFKLSKHIPLSKTLFNIHRAKKLSDTVIVCEAAIDAMRVHQAGFPNVVAICGGHISKDNLFNLNRYFRNIIIMTDFDDKNDPAYKKKNCRACHPNECEGHNPGRDLGTTIAEKLPNCNISWAMYSETEVYPNGAKDAGELTEAEIRQCIRNAKPNFEYVSTGVY